MTKLIGSRKTLTHFYFYRGEVSVVCGCYKGKLTEFRQKVLGMYGDRVIWHTPIERSKKYLNQYLREIRKVKRLWNL